MATARMSITEVIVSFGMTGKAIGGISKSTELVSCFRDGGATHFDAPEIGRAYTECFGEQQGVIAILKRFDAARGTRIVTHDGRAHRIGGDAVGPQNHDPGTCQL